jgi:plasmid maintenance system antidote protein VapI
VTGEELKDAAVKLFGESGWVTALAENLGVDRTQVWRYVNGRTPVPGPVAAAVECWLSRAKDERKR